MRKYVVRIVGTSWWALDGDSSLGPYGSRKVAETAAIAMAKLDFRNGRAAIVTVEEGSEMVEIYNSMAEKPVEIPRDHHQ